MFSFFKKKKDKKYSLKEYIYNNEKNISIKNIEIQKDDLIYIFDLFYNEKTNEILKISNIIDILIENMFEVFKTFTEQDISNYLISKQISVSFYKNVYNFYLLYFLQNHTNTEEILKFLKEKNYYLENDYIFDISFDKWNEIFKGLYGLNIKNNTFYNYLVAILYNKKYDFKKQIENSFILFNLNIFNLDKFYLDYLFKNIPEVFEKIIKKNIEFFNNEEMVLAKFIEFLNKTLKYYPKEEYINNYINILFHYYCYNNNLSYLIDGLKGININYLKRDEFIKVLKNINIDEKQRNKYYLMLKVQKEKENKERLEQLKQSIEKKQEELKNLEEKTKYKCDINIKLTKAKLIQEIKKIKSKIRHFNVDKFTFNNTDFYLSLLIHVDGKTLLKYINSNINKVLLNIYLEIYLNANPKKYKKLLYFLNKAKSIKKYKNLIDLIIEQVLLSEEDIIQLKNIMDYYPQVKQDILFKKIIKYNKEKLTVRDLKELLYNGIDLVYQIFNLDLINVFTVNNIEAVKKYLYFNYKKDLELIKKVLNDEELEFDELDEVNKIDKEKIKNLYFPSETKLEEMLQYYQ